MISEQPRSPHCTLGPLGIRGGPSAVFFDFHLLFGIAQILRPLPCLAPRNVLGFPVGGVMLARQFLADEGVISVRATDGANPHKLIIFWCVCVCVLFFKGTDWEIPNGRSLQLRKAWGGLGRPQGHGGSVRWHGSSLRCREGARGMLRVSPAETVMVRPLLFYVGLLL